jgi:hypothetical protein
MRVTHRFRVGRRTLAAIGLTLCVFLVTAFVAGRDAGTTAPELRTEYFLSFIGVDAEGRDLMWQGPRRDAGAGDEVMLIRLEPLNAPADAARAAPWPLEGIIFVSGDPARSFAADVQGTVDWRAGRVRLEGKVSVGYLEGARVTFTAWAEDFDLRGELRVLAATTLTRTETVR